MSTITRTSGALHAALAAVGNERAIKPLTLRVLLAIDQSTTPPTYESLARDIGVACSSAVRRAMGELYECDFATGRAVDGGRRRQGIPTQVALTDLGVDLARDVVEAYRSHLLQIEIEAVAA